MRLPQPLVGKEGRLPAGALKRPSVSIIVPCREEAAFIGLCLDSILANDYTGSTEIFVVDGMSQDRTRDILAEYAARHSCIQVLDNPRKEQPIALNIGIRQARGDIIMRMDSHTSYAPDYISECINALLEHGADNVGGRWVIVPRSSGLLGQAICLAVTSPFGVGNAYYRLKDYSGKGIKWNVHVPYFCCRREVFKKIGLFNEHLDRSEDIDFRSRLLRGGYRTLFVPTVISYYYMRTDFSDFVRHMFRNGSWVILPLNYASGISFSLRHVIPLIFVLSLAVPAALSFWNPAFLWVSAAVAGLYGAVNVAASAQVAYRAQRWIYLLMLPLVFALLHLSYGLGSLIGLLGSVLGYLRLRNFFVF